jgi:uncharacterized protein involved in exopolysaccharide biosynthesis
MVAAWRQRGRPGMAEWWQDGSGYGLTAALTVGAVKLYDRLLKSRETHEEAFERRVAAHQDSLSERLKVVEDGRYTERRQFQNELADLRAEKLALQAVNDRLTVNNERLTALNDRLTASNEALETKNKALETTISDLESRVNALVCEVAALQAKVGAGPMEVGAVANDLATLLKGP